MIMQELKEATRKQHSGLETNVDVMSSMFSIEDYKVLLCKFYRFYRPVEEELSGFDWDGAGFDIADRKKVPKLEKDLDNLNLLEFARTKVAPWKDPRLLNSLEEAFGTLYVLEGATLGGQIIKRHLQKQFGLDGSNGGAFFTGYGPNTGRMWKEFGAAVTEYADANGKSDLIVKAAKDTFDSFGRCFRLPLEMD